VAHETLSVWCSLASKLGEWALKAELEDLCFAVLNVSIHYHVEIVSFIPCLILSPVFRK
jgi:(p)ppGpp synthase/HD superfamily hydrolase